MELTNAIIQFIHSLQRKKYRDESGCFVAEGEKCVTDIWNSFSNKYIVATKDWVTENPIIASKHNVMLATSSQMSKMSQFSTPSDIIGVFEIPKYKIDYSDVCTQLSIALDAVQDPGNVGTIIRLADWYGVKDVFCGIGCADPYSHKVIQSTMGAIARVKIHNVDLGDFLKSVPQVEKYATMLNGENIYTSKLENKGIIIMGNEGSGISAEILKLVDNRLTIPSFADGETSESLNVAIATAIVVSEFRRRTIK